MIRLVFKPWRRFQARRDEDELRGFLRNVANGAEDAFRKGIAGPKSGRIYRLPGGRSHRASAPGEYPARRTGRLARSIRSKVTQTEASVGTSTFYARFLRSGTSKMQRRRMSDDAMKEAIPEARTRLSRWMRWERG